MSNRISKYFDYGDEEAAAFVTANAHWLYEHDLTGDTVTDKVIGPDGVVQARPVFSTLGKVFRDAVCKEHLRQNEANETMDCRKGEAVGMEAARAVAKTLGLAIPD